MHDYVYLRGSCWSCHSPFHCQPSRHHIRESPYTFFVAGLRLVAERCACKSGQLFSQAGQIEAAKCLTTNWLLKSFGRPTATQEATMSFIKCEVQGIPLLLVPQLSSSPRAIEIQCLRVNFQNIAESSYYGKMQTRGIQLPHAFATSACLAYGMAPVVWLFQCLWPHSRPE